METAVGTRFKTGEKCPTSGRYKFDGYTDGTSSPSPTPAEREIPMSRGETFPPTGSPMATSSILRSRSLQHRFPDGHYAQLRGRGESIGSGSSE